MITSNYFYIYIFLLSFDTVPGMRCLCFKSDFEVAIKTNMHCSLSLFWSSARIQYINGMIIVARKEHLGRLYLLIYYHFALSLFGHKETRFYNMILKNLAPRQEMKPWIFYFRRVRFERNIINMVILIAFINRIMRKKNVAQSNQKTIRKWIFKSQLILENLVFCLCHTANTWHLSPN